MFVRLRFWVLRKLIGRSAVAANLHIINGTLVMSSKRQGFILDCVIENSMGAAVVVE